MKNTIIHLMLLSILLASCSSSSSDKSVIEPLEIDEIEYMIEHDKSQLSEWRRDFIEEHGFKTDFERFYEKAQNFHKYINDDNLTKLKFKDLKYKDYNIANNYLHEFDLTTHGYVHDDSLKILVDDGGWKKSPIYVSVFDTLSSAQRVRELIKQFPNIYIQWEVEEAMQIWLRKQIKIKNDSIWDIYDQGKSKKIRLLEAFESKCWDLGYKNR